MRTAIPIVDGDIPTSDLGPSSTTAMKRGFVCAVPSAAGERGGHADLAARFAREYPRSPCNDPRR